MKEILKAILTTIYEQEGHWSPLSSIFLALEMGVNATHDECWKVVTGLEQYGLVKLTSETITLTRLGVDLAASWAASEASV